MRVMGDLIVSFYFVIELPKWEIVRVLYLVGNFVFFLLIRGNLLSWVLFISRQL